MQSLHTGINYNSLFTVCLFESIINLIRKVVIKLRSPKNNELLQKYAKRKQELKLILDVKTRWTSLYKMVERFLVLIDPVKIVLKKLNDDIYESVSKINLSRLNELVKVLKIMEVGCKTFSRSDFNLEKGDQTLVFILDKLRELGTPLSKRMEESITSRFNSRRSIYSSIIKFIKTGELDDDVTTNDITWECRTLIERLNKQDDMCAENISPNNQSPNLSPNISSNLSSNISSNLSNLETELEKVLSNCKVNAVHLSTLDLNSAIKSEIRTFGKSKIIGKYLDIVYNLVKEIKCSTVDVERVFSNLGLMVTKIRTKLSDDTIDDYLF